VLSANRDLAGAARAFTLLGTAAWSRADRPATLYYLDRAVELYDSLPDTEDKASALLELARVHMLNFELEPAIAASNAAAEMAERLGLTEVHANSMITLATGRCLGGDPEGPAALLDAAAHCRRHHLTSRRRAIQNLAWARLEEGDIAEHNRLLDELTSIDLAGGHSLATNFADESARAYFAGDWPTAIAAAASSMRQPNIEWDHHVLQASWLRVLREEPVGPAGGEDRVDQAVAAARRSGFHRIRRSTLAHAALCRALQGRADDANQLLDELDEDWCVSPMLAFGEWVAAASSTGAILGAQTAQRVRTMLECSARRTPWVKAALLTVDGVLHADAERHLAAAEIYADMGNTTDRMLALAAAARTLVATGHPDRTGGWLPELVEFAHRNRAPRLLDGTQ
jgi:hypothetical protein